MISEFGPVSQTIFLLQELQKAEKSEWKYYIESLPKSMENFPAFYTREERNLLKGSYTGILLDKLIEDVEDDFELVHHLFKKELSAFTLEDFKHYYFIGTSRTFDILVYGQPSSVLAPFVGKLCSK